MPSIEVKNARVLGQVIKAARHAAGVSAATLTDKLGMSTQYLSRLENGVPTIFSTRLFRILNSLRIRVVLTFEPRKTEVDGQDASNGSAPHSCGE
jgi:transcriptional regulator with XRE-family HTH domain